MQVASYRLSLYDRCQHVLFRFLLGDIDVKWNPKRFAVSQWRWTVAILRINSQLTSSWPAEQRNQQKHEALYLPQLMYFQIYRQYCAESTLGAILSVNLKIHKLREIHHLTHAIISVSLLKMIPIVQCCSKTYDRKFTLIMSYTVGLPLSWYFRWWS